MTMLLTFIMLGLYLSVIAVAHFENERESKKAPVKVEPYRLPRIR